MRIRLLSDLHLEGFFFKYEDHGEDLVILAGDIHTRNRHEDFLDKIPEHIKIIMVPGNHEYYHSCFQEVNEYFKYLEKDIKNFHFLNNESIDIDGVSFFGGMMCTDFKLYGEANQYTSAIKAQKGISDFYYSEILDANTGVKRQWTVSDHKEQYDVYNQAFDAWIKTVTNKKKVAISHFLPSEMSCDPQFKVSDLNPYFMTINDSRVKLVDVWVHGHTHSTAKYTLDNTQVYCNPKGYGSENKSFKPDFIFEV